MPETKEELRNLYRSTGVEPNMKTIEMQHNMLIQLGYTPEFGVSCLNKINQDFKTDREVTMKLMQFAKCAELAVRLVPRTINILIC